MLSPTIKREESLEPLLEALPPKRKGALATLLAEPSSRYSSNDDEEPPLPSKASARSSPSRAAPYVRSKPPTAQVKTETPPTKPANVGAENALSVIPATDRENLPRNFKVGGVGVAVRRPGAQARPVFSSRPNSVLSTPQQTLAFTKTRLESILTGRTLISSGGFLAKHYAAHQRKRQINRTAVMDGFNFESHDTTGGNGETGMNGLDPYLGVTDLVPEMGTLTHSDLEYQRNCIQSLQQANLASQKEIERQQRVVDGMIALNHEMYAMIQQLDARCDRFERDSLHLRSMVASNSVASLPPQAPVASVKNNNFLGGDDRGPPREKQKQNFVKASAKRPVSDSSDEEGAAKAERTKNRKKLAVKVTGKASGVASGLALPTPMDSALQTALPSLMMSKFPSTPRTPYTPGRIGPPESYKKSVTSINKRDIHNLNKSIPPTNVQLPMIPLTDTEIIVYFFNSLSRPVVSLRLYARGWGPASIVQSLNDHRVVEPPYLRNTCSVKCTTAIKNGKKFYGDEWEAEYRTVLAEAEDCRATDLIRADEDDTCDYYVRALAVNLKQHPSGEDAGIFTACVKYCIENEAPYTMSNVHQLAVDLQDGNVPEHPASPDPSDVFPVPKYREFIQGDDSGDEWEGDAEGSPSPLAERKPNLAFSTDRIGFTAVNVPHN